MQWPQNPMATSASDTREEPKKSLLNPDDMSPLVERANWFCSGLAGDVNSLPALFVDCHVGLTKLL